MAKCGMSMGGAPIGFSASPSESALLLCTKPHPVLCFWLRVLKSRSAKRVVIAGHQNRSDFSAKDFSWECQGFQRPIRDIRVRTESGVPKD